MKSHSLGPNYRLVSSARLFNDRVSNRAREKLELVRVNNLPSVDLTPSEWAWIVHNWPYIYFNAKFRVYRIENNIFRRLYRFITRQPNEMAVYDFSVSIEVIKAVSGEMLKRQSVIVDGIWRKVNITNARR